MLNFIFVKNRANLVQERLESPYESLNDFRFCKIAANEVCIYGFGSTAEFWRKSIAPAM